MSPLLAQAIGPDTVPGDVTVPTWVLIAAIVGLWLKSEWDRAQQAKRREVEVAAMSASATALDKMADNVSTLATLVSVCRARSS